MKRLRGPARVLAGAAVAVPLALVLFALAACGGGGDSDVASLDRSGRNGSANSGSAQEDPQKAALEFAKCMRAHGVDFPDPDENGGFVITPDVGSDADTFQKAEKACGSGLRRAPGGATPPQQLSEEDRAALQEAFLKFAKCMREHGVEIPDPDSGSPGGGFALQLPKGLKPDDPRFRQAQEACQPLLNEAMRKAGLSSPGGGS